MSILSSHAFYSITLLLFPLINRSISNSLRGFEHPVLLHPHHLSSSFMLGLRSCTQYPHTHTRLLPRHPVLFLEYILKNRAHSLQFLSTNPFVYSRMSFPYFSFLCLPVISSDTCLTAYCSFVHFLFSH